MAAKVRGADKFIRRLKETERHLRGQTARRATARAAVIGRDSIKGKIRRADGAYIVRLKNGQQIVRYPGDLSRALIVKYLTPSESGKWSAHKITFLKKQDNGIGRIAHLIEKGVAAHAIPLPNGGHYVHPGHAAYPFMQPGLDAAKGAMRSAMVHTVRQDILKLGSKK